jgi:hypothetical protein
VRGPDHLGDVLGVQADNLVGDPIRLAADQIVVTTIDGAVTAPQWLEQDQHPPVVPLATTGDRHPIDLTKTGPLPENR